MNSGLSGPADDQAGEQIHDDRQLEPSFPRADVRDVRDPGGVGLRSSKLALQEIRDQDRGLTHVPASGAIAVERPQMGFPHQPCDAMLAARLSGFTQIEEDARGTIDAVARRKRRTNQPKQSGVLLRAIRHGLQDPVVIAARGHLKDAAHHLHAVLMAVSLDELVCRTFAP